MSGDRRWCYYVPATSFDEENGGFVPSMVEEGVMGHRPMTGRGEGAAPWVWGSSLEEAREVCRAANERMGITEDDAAEIVASSMTGAIMRRV
jgi:hypothetical protein